MSFFSSNNFSTTSFLNISATIFMVCSSILAVQSMRATRRNYGEIILSTQEYLDLVDRSQEKSVIQSSNNEQTL